MKKKWSLNELLEDNRFLKIFAVVLSVMLYFIVAMTEKDTIDRVIPNVPVDLDLQSAALTNLGLNVVDGQQFYVDIRVNGARTLVPQLGPDSPELATTVRIGDVTEPGTHVFPVISALSSTADLPFTIVSYTPSAIEVRLDRYRTSTFEIKSVVNGLSVAQNYVVEGERVNPQAVSVTGPESEVSRIAGAEVRLELNQPLDHTQATTLPILLRDEQGEIIDPEESHLTLDITEAQLVITVLKETGLPLQVEFLNVPRAFPEDALREYMQMSDDYTLIAGPSDVVDRLTEIPLGYIDLKELRPGESSFGFQVDLEEISRQIQSLDNIANVSVYFDDAEWATTTFTINDIRKTNEPLDMDIEVRATRLDVQFVAVSEDIFEGMTAADIVAEVDFGDRELTPGQSNYPVKISVPGKGLVWAVGSHTTVIQVTEHE